MNTIKLKKEAAEKIYEGKNDKYTLVEGNLRYEDNIYKDENDNHWRLRISENNGFWEDAPPFVDDKLVRVRPTYVTVKKWREVK